MVPDKLNRLGLRVLRQLVGSPYPLGPHNGLIDARAPVPATFAPSARPVTCMAVPAHA